ncbi:hypothetical protein ACFL1K_02850 [Candidatus Omnitrophota bacterium]
MKNKKSHDKEEARPDVIRGWRRERSDDLTRQPRRPGRLFGLIKFIIGICVLPFVYSSSVAFLCQLNLLAAPLRSFFWSGTATFLIIYLFVFEPVGIYYRGFRFLEVIFTFFSPLLKVAPYVLPVYSILIFAGYAWYAGLPSARNLDTWFLFLFAFSLTLHLVLGANQVRSRKEGFLKSDYIFGFSVVYITALIIAVACLNVFFKNISFIRFVEQASSEGQGIFAAVFGQLF